MESQSASHTPLRADFVLTPWLALPLIIAEVGWMSMGTVDTIMVGRRPDSAVAIGEPLSQHRDFWRRPPA